MRRQVDQQPNDPASGDVHFYDETVNLWRTDSLPRPRCATEYGVPSIPLNDTMLRYVRPEDWAYLSEAMLRRNHHPFGVVTLPLMLARHFSLSPALRMDSWAYLSQVHQALALRTQTEHYRRLRGALDAAGLGQTMCALYWQLNDVWAGTTWASLDFHQRWKAAHYHARHMFAELLVSMVGAGGRGVQPSRAAPTPARAAARARRLGPDS